MEFQLCYRITNHYILPIPQILPISIYLKQIFIILRNVILFFGVTFIHNFQLCLHFSLRHIFLEHFKIIKDAYKYKTKFCGFQIYFLKTTFHFAKTFTTVYNTNFALAQCIRITRSFRMLSPCINMYFKYKYIKFQQIRKNQINNFSNDALMCDGNAASSSLEIKFLDVEKEAGN